MKHAIFTFVLLALLCSPNCRLALADNQPAMGLAARAAESWLRLVDAGRYRRSYKEASGYFQSRIDQQKWVATVEPVRKPLGQVISCKLAGAQYTTSLPGAPDAQYVVMQFDTSFQN